MNIPLKWHALAITVAAGTMLVLLSGCANLPVEGSMRAQLDIIRNCSNFKSPIDYSGPEDHDNFGVRVLGQYDPGMKDRIVVDLGYSKVGDTEFDGLFQGVPDQGTIETETFQASVGYRYPFTDSFSAGGRIGAAYVDVSESELFDGSPFSASASETLVYGGIVGRFAINKYWGVSMFFDHYPDVGKADRTGEGDLEVYGVGVDFRFGGSNSDE